jgi:TM2 domain-containing membrane protein YozV
MMYSARTFFWLTFFFGGLGVGHFYLGNAKRGLLYIFTLGGFLGILPFVDLFRSKKVTTEANERVRQGTLQAAL